MASKFKPGIPETFTFDVAPVQDLGDYLDESGPTPPPVRRPKASAPPLEPTAKPTSPVTPTPLPSTPSAVLKTYEPLVVSAAAVPPSAPAPQRTEEWPARHTHTIEEAPEARNSKPKGPRREISMTHETLQMSDELLELVRRGSGQRDTKANELFHALVLLVHEAMDEIDPHGIPKRGRWGTPTARAYPLELKNAFLRALLKKYAEAALPPNGFRYAANDEP